MKEGSKTHARTRIEALGPTAKGRPVTEGWLIECRCGWVEQPCKTAADANARYTAHLAEARAEHASPRPPTELGTGPRKWGVRSQVCKWCEQERPVGDFARSPDSGWITRECRHCAEERLACWTKVEVNPVVVGRRYVDKASPTLLCTRCGRDRPKSLFYTFSNGAGRRCFRPKCKQCAGAEMSIYRQRTGYSQNPERQRKERDWRLRRKFGITVVEYEALLASQDGRCAICRTEATGGPTPTSALHVDHCHDTDRVRGLLCRACNTAIGLLKEDPALFAAALEYLRKDAP